MGSVNRNRLEGGGVGNHMKENDKITCVQKDEHFYLVLGQKYTVQYSIVDGLTFGQMVYIQEIPGVPFPVGLFREGRKIKVRKGA